MSGPTLDHVCDHCPHPKHRHGRPLIRKGKPSRSVWSCLDCHCRFAGPFGGTLPAWAAAQRKPRP